MHGWCSVYIDALVAVGFVSPVVFTSLEIKVYIQSDDINFQNDLVTRSGNFQNEDPEQVYDLVEAIIEISRSGNL